MPVRFLAQTRHGHELADGLLGRLAWPRQGLQKPLRLKSLYLDKSWAACLGPFAGTLALPDIGHRTERKDFGPKELLRKRAAHLLVSVDLCPESHLDVKWCTVTSSPM